MYERAVGDCGEVGDCNRYCKRSFGLDVCFCFCCCVCLCGCVLSTSSKTGQRSQSYTLTTTTSHVSSRFVTISEMILIKNLLRRWKRSTRQQTGHPLTMVRLLRKVWGTREKVEPTFGLLQGWSQTQPIIDWQYLCRFSGTCKRRWLFIQFHNGPFSLCLWYSQFRSIITSHW